MHTALSEDVKNTILAVLPDATVYAIDPDGEHLEALVISPTFVGQPLVKQHQTVMKALKEHFAERVHALALKTFTPERWEKEKGRYPV